MKIKFMSKSLQWHSKATRAAETRFKPLLLRSIRCQQYPKSSSMVCLQFFFFLFLSLPPFHLYPSSGKFVGGNDATQAKHRSGELAKLLAA